MFGPRGARGLLDGEGMNESTVQDAEKWEVSETIKVSCVTNFFFCPREGWVILESILPIYILKRASRDRSAFYMSKMCAHVAADARVTSGALYL
jgi:hypothetical protein